MRIETVKEISLNLRRIARDVEQTAVGSSRVRMYNELAEAIRNEADKVDMIANFVGSAQFRVTKDGDTNKS